MENFKKITKQEFGKSSYSTRTDYLNFYQDKYNLSQDDILTNDDLIISATKNWFTQGQVGCAFAKYMAKDTQQFGWDFITYTENDFSKNKISELYDDIKYYIKKEHSETLSVIFPLIKTEKDFANLIHSLISNTDIFIEKTLQYNNHTLLAMRLDISGHENNSWIMALGPLDTFPLTRQAPFLQLVIRLKVKDTDRMYSKAKNVPDAHNADMPVDMLPIHMQDRLWEASFKNTKRVLGHKPDNLSAAKYTCPLSTNLFNKLDIIKKEN